MKYFATPDQQHHYINLLWHVYRLRIVSMGTWQRASIVLQQESNSHKLLMLAMIGAVT